MTRPRTTAAIARAHNSARRSAPCAAAVHAPPRHRSQRAAVPGANSTRHRTDSRRRGPVVRCRRRPHRRPPASSRPRTPRRSGQVFYRRPGILPSATHPGDVPRRAPKPGAISLRSRHTRDASGRTHRCSARRRACPACTAANASRKSRRRRDRRRRVNDAVLERMRCSPSGRCPTRLARRPVSPIRRADGTAVRANRSGAPADASGRRKPERRGTPTTHGKQLTALRLSSSRHLNPAGSTRARPSASIGEMGGAGRGRLLVAQRLAASLAARADQIRSNQWHLRVPRRRRRAADHTWRRT